MKKISLGLLSLAAVWAQLEGPTSGYVFSGGALRPIRGLAGSAYLGGALIKDADLVSASADGQFAAVSRAGRLELVRGFDTPSPSRTVLVEEAGAVSLAWSGHALAAVFTASRRAMVWSDVAQSGVETIDLGGLEGAVKSVALDGATLWIAAQGGLYRAQPGAAAERVAVLVDPAAVVAGKAGVFAADRGANLVLQVTDGGVRNFAAVAEPVGLQLTKRQLLVASAHAQSVEMFDLASGARTGALDLEFAPTRLDGVGTRSLALLNDASADEPLFVLDYRDALSAYFVPAGREQ